ncbi:hypothetical protein GCM10027275_52000 [Rhabdobacter roseus]
MCVNLKTFNESFREWARQQEEAATFEDTEQPPGDQPPTDNEQERTNREHRSPPGLRDGLVFP